MWLMVDKADLEMSSFIDLCLADCCVALAERQALPQHGLITVPAGFDSVRTLRFFVAAG